MAETPVSRRLLLVPPQIGPMSPVPMGPGVVAASQNPGAGGAVTETPASAPGMLPATHAQPLYDPTAPVNIPAVTGDGAGEGWQGALQRALIGFGKGASRIPVDPTYNPLGAGIVGGLETTGATVNDAIQRRLALQAQAVAPFREAQTAALKKSYEDAAHAPYAEKEAQDSLNRAVKEHELNIQTDLKASNIEPMAQRLSALPPSIRQLDLGRQSGPVRMALENRIFEINQGKGATYDADLEKQYQSSLAGGVSGATYNFGAGAQNSARAANTVQMLLPDLKKASEAYSRPEVRAANGVLNWVDTQTGGTKAQTWQQYLLELKTKASAALQSGGVPQQEAQARIDRILPDTMGPEQASTAADTLNGIMETQKQGALTPVTLTPPVSKYAHLTDAQIRARLPKGWSK